MTRTLKAGVVILLIIFGACFVFAAGSVQDSSKTSFSNFVVGDSAHKAGALNAEKAAVSGQRLESFKLIKRSLDYKEQMTIAIWMMAFIALMITTSQAWNPG